MKQLSINWQDLEMAFEDHAGEDGMERTNYFDLECGEVVFLDEEICAFVLSVDVTESTCEAISPSARLMVDSLRPLARERVEFGRRYHRPQPRHRTGGRRSHRPNP